MFSSIDGLKCVECLQEKQNNTLAANSLENPPILCFKKSESKFCIKKKKDENREDGGFLLNVMSTAILASIEHCFTIVH